MMKKWKVIAKRIFAFSLTAILVSGTSSLPAFAKDVAIEESGGWLETAYTTWRPVPGATAYHVYVKSANANDSAYTQIDDELIREYPSYWRADAIGLPAGNYVMKVEAVHSNGTKEDTVTNSLNVNAHDRSGFAFSSDSPFKTGSGAYEENGALKEGAQVIYVTSDTAKTVTLDVIVNKSGKKQTATGIGEILKLREKGYDKTPLAIRFVGQVTKQDVSGQLNSNGYLQVKGKGSYAEMNMTLEGIGEDATAYGWGILVRNCGNTEIRNLGLMMFPDDGVSLDTSNCNVWVHNNDFFYGTAGSDADQAKGDGSADVKKGSTYITLSFNHFWDSGKSSLCGLSETSEFFVTYHHNWFDHSDSRHPRIRTGSVHIYNNYYDGNAKYGVGITSGGSAFVEANDFRNCKYPMMISLQGTDALGKGTFSKEDGGMIKAFQNKVEGANSLIYANSDSGTTTADAVQFDAYLSSSRNETVPDSYKAFKGNTAYNNFDTKKDIGVSASDVDDVNEVRDVVTEKAGRLNKGDFTWEFDNVVDDTFYNMNDGLMAKIRSYHTELVSIGGIK